MKYHIFLYTFYEAGYYTASYSTIEKAKEYIEEDIMWRKRKIVNVKKKVAEYDIDIQNYKKGDLDAANG